MASIITDFTPDEENIAAGERINDPEFDQGTSQVCWQDPGGRLWVAPVDPVSGEFQLEDKLLLDIGLAPIGRRDDTDAASGNGPEWIVTESGSDILYTKAISEDPSTWEVWGASWNGTKWETQFLASGASPNGSTTPGDPDPKFIFRQADDGGVFDLLWYDYDTGETGLVTTKQTKGARWVNKKSEQVVFAQGVGGTRQIFLYDVELESTTQLTFGGTDKSRPSIWEAPELDGRRVLMTLEDGQNPQTLGIYVESDDGSWNKALELVPPTERRLIYSPEPFVYEGRSGISFVAKDEFSPAEAESEVWLAGLGPSGPVYREVSEPERLARNDPETFATEEGLFVYYNVKSFDGTIPPSIFRASTGVVPASDSLSASALDSDGRHSAQVQVHLKPDLMAKGNDPSLYLSGPDLDLISPASGANRNSLVFDQTVSISALRADQGDGTASFSLLSGGRSVFLLQNANGGAAGSMTPRKALNPHGDHGWRATEGRQVGAAAALHNLDLTGSSWTPTASLDGQQKALQAVQVEGNRVTAEFEGGLTLRLFLETVLSAPYAASARPEVHIQRLAGYNNTLGFYPVDSITGLVDGLNPGEDGYLRAALARAEASDLLLGASDLPGYGEERSIPDLPLDPKLQYGVLLLQNGRADRMFSSFAAANPSGSPQMVSLGDDSTGMVLGIEDTDVSGGLSDRDYNDIILKISGLQAPMF